MTLTLRKRDLSGDLTAEVQAEISLNLSSCVQCKKCSAGCPLAGYSDLLPHELVRLVQLGQSEEVLQSRMIWQCTSCHTCATRCPQRVDICSMNDSLRRMSRERATVNDASTLPVFNDSFLASVKRYGRVYEVGLMAAYKLKTLRLFEDMDKLPLMLKKRKLRLLPTSVAGGSERRRLWKRAQLLRGK
jgi:heterodisulfide reductase subunit C2